MKKIILTFFIIIAIGVYGAFLILHIENQAKESCCGSQACSRLKMHEPNYHAEEVK